MDLLTPSINVPAERAKLRVLRDEIAADVEHRKAIQRKYTARGFVRLDYVPDLHPLATEVRPGNGKAPDGPMRSSPAMGVPTAFADVREAKPGCCGRCSREGCMEQQGVSL